MPKSKKLREGERFKCPYPGCKRSFAELWRLKVHYRAPPDVRGSGKERGHGQELSHCPLCDAKLMPGKHHIQCTGSKAQSAQVRLVETSSLEAGHNHARSCASCARHHFHLQMQLYVEFAGNHSQRARARKLRRGRARACRSAPAPDFSCALRPGQ